MLTISSTAASENKRPSNEKENMKKMIQKLSYCMNCLQRFNYNYRSG